MERMKAFMAGVRPVWEENSETGKKRKRVGGSDPGLGVKKRRVKGREEGGGSNMSHCLASEGALDGV